MEFVEAPHPNIHNHRLVHPPDTRLWRTHPRSLCRVLELDGPGVTPYLRVVIAGPHSSITMLEVNNGLGSAGKLLQIALYA